MPQDVTTMEQPKLKTKAVTPTITANETTVSANLVDLGGTAWAGALITINFQPAPNIPGPYFWGGGLFSLRPQLTADSSGHFSITLPDNTTITPAGSTWQFVIAPNATMPAVIFNLMIAGAAMDISSVFTAQSYQVSLGTVQSLPLPRAYQDSDVATPPNAGQLYYNTAAQSVMVWQAGTQLALPAWHSIVTGAYTILPAGQDLNAGSQNYGHAGFYFIPSGAVNGPATATNTNVTISMLGNIEFYYSEDDPSWNIYYRVLGSGAGGPTQWGDWASIFGFTVVPESQVGPWNWNVFTYPGNFMFPGVSAGYPPPAGDNTVGAILEVFSNSPGGQDGTMSVWQRAYFPNSSATMNSFFTRFGTMAIYAGATEVTWGSWIQFNGTAV